MIKNIRLESVNWKNFSKMSADYSFVESTFYATLGLNEWNIDAPLKQDAVVGPNAIQLDLKFPISKDQFATIKEALYRKGIVMDCTNSCCAL